MDYFNKTKGVFLAAAIVASSSAFAQAGTGLAEGFQWLFSSGLTYGGDKLAKATSKNGNYDLRAGGLFYFGGGGSYRLANSPMSVQGEFAYQFDSIHASNGHAYFDRTEFDLMSFYNIGTYRFGVGVTEHFNVNYNEKIDYQYTPDYHFDNATGLLVEYDYMFSPNIGMGIRYTNIKYDFTTPGGYYGYVYYPPTSGTIDGNNFGLFAHFFF